ncbi:hypothetical protein [Mycoplasma sp. P36-A1]|uniref:hypothetical protein n=1 Tax=Mycoplasma sp. P36-A1 TaxID=3252900 RepID=UPI003C2C927F
MKNRFICLLILFTLVLTISIVALQEYNYPKEVVILKEQSAKIEVVISSKKENMNNNNLYLIDLIELNKAYGLKNIEDADLFKESNRDLSFLKVEELKEKYYPTKNEIHTRDYAGGKSAATVLWASKKETMNNKKTYYCTVKSPFDKECYNSVTLVTSAWKAQGVTIRFPYESVS